MAQWKETLEPYIRVHEKIKAAALNPVAGEDLIIGCAFVSDAGSSLPTLITSQKEFLENYSSQDITEDYINSFKDLYKGSDSNLGPSMWLNAYRLAGSNTLLAVRATKAKDLYFAKVSSDTTNDYIIRDGQVLRKVTGRVKLSFDSDGNDATWRQKGWAIKLREIGIVGNLVSEEGVAYDYYVDNLFDLVEYLNDTNLFFSPDYEFHNNINQVDGVNSTTRISEDSLKEEGADKSAVKAVVFNELYLGSKVLDGFDNKTEEESSPSYGLAQLYFGEPDWTWVKSTTGTSTTEGNTEGTTESNTEGEGTTGGTTTTGGNDQLLISLNDRAYSGYDQETTLAKGYVTNVFNSSTNLKVRIRRFNHDYVATKQLTESDANANGESPYTVLNTQLSSLVNNNISSATGDSRKNKIKALEDRDFYEIAVLDPSVSGEVLYFNLGNVLSLGDMELVDINNSLKMVQINLPDDLSKLGLGYFVSKDASAIPVPPSSDPEEGLNTEKEYVYNLKIDPTETALLNVSNSDILKALDQIPLNEVYTVEGLADLGCTEPIVQSYMANMAINDNFFYPISTVNSTNYLAIANSIARISQNSHKLYASAPWDVDTGTVGWKFYCSPDVLYWESVGRNRRLGREFAPVLGQTNGIAQYQKPVAEFNKKVRQLLLSKKINTVLWDVQTQAWDWNDNYTKQTENNIMSDEANSRLMIRISKAMPVLLRQFIGRRIGNILWTDMYNVIDYWFKTTILSMSYTIDGYRITIDETNNTPEDARANRVNVLIEARYQRAAKYIEVYNNAFDVGMEFDGIM